MARRDALNLSLTLEANRGNTLTKNMMLEVRRPVSGFELSYLIYWMQSAHFATACDQHSTELASFLSELLEELSDDEDVGVEPYQVPRRLIDPKFRRGMFLSFDLFFFLVLVLFQDWRPVARPCPPGQRAKSSHICQQWIEKLF